MPRGPSKTPKAPGDPNPHRLSTQKTKIMGALKALSKIENEQKEVMFPDADATEVEWDVPEEVGAPESFDAEQGEYTFEELVAVYKENNGKKGFNDALVTNICKKFPNLLYESLGEKSDPSNPNSKLDDLAEELADLDRDDIDLFSSEVWKKAIQKAESDRRAQSKQASAAKKLSNARKMLSEDWDPANKNRPAELFLENIAWNIEQVPPEPFLTSKKKKGNQQEAPAAEEKVVEYSKDKRMVFKIVNLPTVQVLGDGCLAVANNKVIQASIGASHPVYLDRTDRSLVDHLGNQREYDAVNVLGSIEILNLAIKRVFAQEAAMMNGTLGSVEAPPTFEVFLQSPEAAGIDEAMVRLKNEMESKPAAKKSGSNSSVRAKKVVDFNPDGSKKKRTHKDPVLTISAKWMADHPNKFPKRMKPHYQLMSQKNLAGEPTCVEQARATCVVYDEILDELGQGGNTTEMKKFLATLKKVVTPAIIHQLGLDPATQLDLDLRDVRIVETGYPVFESFQVDNGNLLSDASSEDVRTWQKSLTGQTVSSEEILAAGFMLTIPLGDPGCLERVLQFQRYTGEREGGGKPDLALIKWVYLELGSCMIRSLLVPYAGTVGEPGDKKLQILVVKKGKEITLSKAYLPDMVHSAAIGDSIKNYKLQWEEELDPEQKTPFAHRHRKGDWITQNKSTLVGQVKNMGSRSSQKKNQLKTAVEFLNLGSLVHTGKQAPCNSPEKYTEDLDECVRGKKIREPVAGKKRKSSSGESSSDDAGSTQS